MAVYRITPPQNPLGRVVAALVALAVLAAAFMLGLVALAIVAGLGLLVGIVAWLRGLLRRSRPPVKPEPSESGPRSRTTIEAEYTVVSRRREP